MNEEKMREIWIKLNDVDGLLYDMSIVFDVLNIYTEVKTNTSDSAQGISLILENLNKKYSELQNGYDNLQTDVFEFIKSLK